MQQFTSSWRHPCVAVGWQCLLVSSCFHFADVITCSPAGQGSVRRCRWVTRTRSAPPEKSAATGSLARRIILFIYSYSLDTEGYWRWACDRQTARVTCWRQLQFHVFVAAATAIEAGIDFPLLPDLQHEKYEFSNCPTRCDLFSLLYFCRQLYMFRLLTPIIRSSYSCNYSFWYRLTAMNKICCY